MQQLSLVLMFEWAMALGGRKRAKRRRSLLTISVALTLVGSAFSAPGAGAVGPGPTLDSSFADGGRVVVHLVQPPEEGLPSEVLVGKGGSISVPTGDYIFRYRPDGRPEFSFGNNGRLRIVASEPDLGFDPKFLVAEGGGRFTVGGTTERRDAEQVVLQAWPTVRRYGPDGRPDAAFGQAGVFMSDLGFPPLAPYVEENSGGYYEMSPAAFGRPHVFLKGLSAAEKGGYVLEGEGVLTENACESQLFPRTYQLFTARLEPDGALDPNFGEGGVEKEPVVDLECQIIRGRDEEPNSPSRAFIGTPKHARAIASDFGVDAKGRTTMLVQLRKYVEGRAVINREYLVRLTRAGGFDPSFGDDGRMHFRPPEGPALSTHVSGIHVAADGRVLLVGTTRSRHQPKGPKTGRYLLGEVDPSGRLIRRGGSAFTTIGLGKGVDPNAPTILPAGHDRVLLWSSLGGFYGKRGFALARVKPGHR